MNKGNSYIFIRGLTRGNIHWGAFRQLAESKLKKENCEFLEIPGNGDLYSMTTPTSPEEVIFYLRKHSRLINESRRVHLCGISLGGMIALKWSELYPDEVEHVFLINTSFSQLSYFYDRLRPSIYIKLFKTLFDTNLHQRERTILEVTSNTPENVKNYAHNFGEYAVLHPVSRLNFLLQLILAVKIKINHLENDKVTVLYSDNDRLVSMKCSLSLIKKYKLKSHAHKSAGHDLPLDDPSWLIEKITYS